MKNIIFIAPPAAGKGTYAKILAEKYNIPHISTGELLREEATKSTDLGKIVNQKFVSIPYYMLLQQLKYKCKLEGITLIVSEESYTSGCSAIDLEPISKKYYNKSRRITRGLFKSGYGVLNADINGSLNILRKAEKCIPDLVNAMRDKGNWNHPKRIRFAY